jgi:hypothetical protein
MEGLVVVVQVGAGAQIQACHLSIILIIGDAGEDVVLVMMIMRIVEATGKKERGM